MGLGLHLRVLKLAGILIGSLLALFSSPGLAGELVSNGSFEINAGPGSESFQNWTIVRQSGSLGGFFAQTSTDAPLVAFTVPTPPVGSYAAMSDQVGPSSSVIYQDVAIPVGATSTFSIRLFVQNQADNYFAPATLDYTMVPNQQVRIDVMSPLAPLFSVNSGVLRNLFVTTPRPNTSPKLPEAQSYLVINSDLTAFAGQTVRIRIAEVDNQQGLNVGIDSASINFSGSTTVPSPPVNVTATAEIQQITVSFGVPLSNGGNAISGYTVTCTALGRATRSASGPVSPIIVTGLTGGVTYACTVIANNGSWNSTPSAALAIKPKGVNISPILMLLLD